MALQKASHAQAGSKTRKGAFIIVLSMAGTIGGVGSSFSIGFSLIAQTANNIDGTIHPAMMKPTTLKPVWVLATSYMEVQVPRHSQSASFCAEVV